MHWLTRAGKAQTAVDLLNAELEMRGIGWADFWVAWRAIRADDVGATPEWNERLERAAQFALVRRKPPDDLPALKALVKDVEKLFATELPQGLLDTPIERLLRTGRSLFSLLLFAFVCYMVLGGLATQDTLLFGEAPRVWSFVTLSILLTALAAFEGLQVGVVTLRLKDLFALRERFPRSVRLHKLFRDAAGMNKFLAGRQLVVILVVFFGSRITSFPEMTEWPFIGFAFPNWMMPWFADIFLELGVLGAFFILWFGQLLPQFMATKNPTFFLNLPGMSWVLRISFLAELLGLTRPADWLATPVQESAEIPMSPAERYSIEADSVYGYGVVCIRKEWLIRPESCTLNYQSIFQLLRSGYETLVDSNLIMQFGASSTSFESSLSSITGEPSRDLSVAEGDEETLPGDWLRLAQGFSPKIGTFRQGDVLVNSCTVVFPYCPTDRLIINRPTRFIIFRLRFEDDPTLQGVTMEVLRWDEITREDKPKVIPLNIEVDPEGAFAEYCEMFPEVGTSYVLSWTAKY